MNCLLIGATAKEIELFLQHYKSSKTLRDVDVLITGIGLTATTFHLSKQVHLKRPGLVIQAGVAGCFDKQLSLGDVVVIKQDTIADESVVELEHLKTMFDLKLVPQNQSPYQKGWLINPNTNLINKSKLRTVNGISVNQITVSNQTIEFYKNKFNPVVESMEGSALHYVCLMEKIPFLQIRSISNYIGERNKKNWNMKESIHNLNQEVIQLIDTITGNK